MPISWAPGFGRRKRVSSISLSDITAPTPQEWAALVSQSLKRLPLSSPLHVLPLAMGALDYQTWQHRFTFVTERYHQLDKSLDYEHLFEQAFTTLESLCVGEEAEESLYAFRSAFLHDQEAPLEDEPHPSHLEDHSSALLLESIESIDGLGELDRNFQFPFPPAFPKPLRGHLSLPNMGTLADVTNKANNTPRNLSSRHGPPHSPPKPKMNISTPRDRGYKETPPPPGFVHPFRAMVEGIPEPPRYLTPTSSSRAQAGVRRQVQGQPGSTTPTTVSTPPSALKGPKWVASAARRVGLSRIPGDTPRPKTALSYGHQNVKMHGKKPEQQSYLAGRASATPSKVSSKLLDKPSPTDKPLPSPPVVQVVLPDATPIPTPRTLLDASDRPLRRTPPGSSGVCEEWPVLSPKKPTIYNATHGLSRVDKSLPAIVPRSEAHGHTPTRIGLPTGRAVTDPTNLATKKSDLTVTLKPLSPTAPDDISSEKTQDSNGTVDSPPLIPASDDHLVASHPHSALSGPSGKSIETSLPDTPSTLEEGPTSANITEKQSLIPRFAGTPDAHAPLFEDGIPTIDTEDMSPSAAAVEKFSSIPRPTRDLSMRARVFEDESKSVNTKVTCTPEPTGKQDSVPMKSSLRSRSAAITSTQTPSKVRRTIDTRASPPRASNQPPAKFITSIPRPSSRSSQLSANPRPNSRTGSRASSSQSYFGALRHRSSKASLDSTGYSSASEDRELKLGGRVRRLSSRHQDHGPTLRISPSAERIIMGDSTGTDTAQKVKDSHDATLLQKVVTKEHRKASESRQSQRTSISSIISAITAPSPNDIPENTMEDDPELESGDKFPQPTRAPPPTPTTSDTSSVTSLKESDPFTEASSSTTKSPLFPASSSMAFGSTSKGKDPSHASKSPRGRAGSSPFPARTSSRTPAPDYTTKAHSKLIGSPITQDNLATKMPGEDTENSESRSDTIQDAKSKILEGGKNNTGPDTDKKLVENSDGKAFHIQEKQKRFSEGSKKGKLFDMFKKRTTVQSDAVASNSGPPKGKGVSVTRDGSPYPTTDSSLKPKNQALTSHPLPTSRPHVPNTHPRTPPLQTSEQDRDLKAANTLVMNLLEDARLAPNSPRKEGLLQLGSLMVDVLTEARHAAQHAEKAKVEAARAELAYMQSHASVQAAVQLLEKYDAKTHWLDPNYKKSE